MKNVFMEGERIYLRPLEVEDAEALQVFLNDPEVTRTLGRYLPLSKKQEEDWLGNLGKHERDIGLGIVRKDQDRLIGSVGLHLPNLKDHRARFGIGIGDKASWNQGFGTEATKLIVRYGFETLNLHRIELDVVAFNPRAIRVYEKAGFKQEGVLREAWYRDGRYWDLIVMGILRAHWDAQQR
jgi:RimJ/RimL family protein N-acetyltransferase